MAAVLPRVLAALAGTLLAAELFAASGVVLRVGPQHELKSPSAAAQLARDGDTVEIEAGLYAGDVAVWRQNNLTLRAIGGRAHLRADGAHAEGKAIWVLKGANTTIEGIEFSGAKVRDRNGAGIRLEGAGLTVRDCYFHHNENGILTGAHRDSDIVVEHSEFAHNGAGDGQSHNLYIGAVRTFTLRYSYVHHAVVGHNVKSRALKNLIAYNRIMDERDGRGSYSIDLPNGGLAFVIGNLLQQGPANDNRTLVAYGAEGLKHPMNELHFVHNTAVNDDPKGGRFVFVKPGADAVRLQNNLFAGPGELLAGPGELQNSPRVSASEFSDAKRFDYHLRKGSRAIARGADPGAPFGFALRPTSEYVHKAKSRPRSDSKALDLGALAYRPR